MQSNRVNYLFLYLIINRKLDISSDVESKSSPVNFQMATYVKAVLFDIKDGRCYFDIEVLGHAGYPGGEREEKLLNTIVDIEASALTFLMASLNSEIDELMERHP